MSDSVEGVAVALPQYIITELEGPDNYNIPNWFKKVEMYVAPSDLGPNYKIAFKAYVYIFNLKKDAPFLMPSLQYIYKVALTIYYHNKLQAADTDKKVSTEMTLGIFNAADGKWKETFRGRIA